MTGGRITHVGGPTTPNSTRRRWGVVNVNLNFD